MKGYMKTGFACSYTEIVAQDGFSLSCQIIFDEGKTPFTSLYLQFKQVWKDTLVLGSSCNAYNIWGG